MSFPKIPKNPFRRRSPRLRRLEALAESWFQLSHGESNTTALDYLATMLLPNDDELSRALFKIARRGANDDFQGTHDLLARFCWEGWTLHREHAALMPVSFCLKRAAMAQFASSDETLVPIVPGPELPC